MADSDPKKPRFQERKRRDDDDDDDALPQPRRRRDLDDDEEDRPVRPKVADRPPILFLIGLIVGALSVTTCCGVSGWWTYASVLRGGSPSGGGGGWSLFGANDFEIVAASRSPGFGFNSAPQVSWKAIVKTTDLKVQNYYMVMKCGNVTHAEPFSIPALKGAEVSQSMPQPALRNTTGPLELWVEKRTDPNKSGTRVSNTFTVR